MGQTVSDIMTTDLVALSAEHSVRDAARRMREANVGAIVVQKHGNLFGIVTDRDIVVRCLAHGHDCDETPLGEICSPDVTTLGPDDEVDRAVTVMRDKAIRRIPVVKNGKAVGILSLGDLALQRDPFSALGAISKALPNNEISRSEISRSEISRSEISRSETSRSEPSWSEISHTEVPRMDLPSHSNERPTVARTTPTVRLAAVRR